jgi:hypothetical protein
VSLVATRDDYLPGRSDIDVAVAVSRPLTDAEKERLEPDCGRALLRQSREANA